MALVVSGNLRAQAKEELLAAGLARCLATIGRQEFAAQQADGFMLPEAEAEAERAREFKGGLF